MIGALLPWLEDTGSRRPWLRIVEWAKIGIGLAMAAAIEASILRPSGRGPTDVGDLWAVTFVFGLGFFIVGRIFGAVAQESAQKRVAYLALSDEEKLIAKSDVLGGAFLIHWGADPTVRNPDGLTAADIASRWPSTVDVFLGKAVPPSFPKMREHLERHWS